MAMALMKGRIPEMRRFDAVKTGDKVCKRAEKKGEGRSGFTVPLMFGETVLNFGRALVVSEPEKTTLDEIVDPETKGLRKQTLERSPGMAFVSRTAEYATSGAAGTFFPAGPVIGYGYAGGTHDKGATVESIRLEHPGIKGDDPLAVPACAQKLLDLKPGESISITRTGKTNLFVGNLNCRWLDSEAPDGTWVAGGPFGVELAINHDGKTTTEVLRQEGSKARVRIYSHDTKGAELSAGVHVGIYLSWLGTAAYEIGRRLNSAGKTASEMASMPVWREHTSGAFVGVAKEKGKDCLAEIDFDLSKQGAKEAYAMAIRGDLNRARQLAEIQGSGVTVPLSRATEISKKSIPVSLGLFGIGISWDNSSENHKTTAYVDGDVIDETRSIEKKSRSTTGLDLRTAHRSVWVDRFHTKSRSGRKLPGFLTTHRACVGVRAQTKDPLTSKEEILREVDFTLSLLGERTPTDAEEYRQKIEALEPEKLIAIGPRNEGGSTHATIHLRFIRGAPKRLAASEPETIYRLMAEIEAKNEGEAPDWADPKVRATYDREASDGELDWKELSPSYLSRRQAYFNAKSQVAAIEDMSQGSVEARNKKLRDFIGTDADRRDRIELIARLLGPQCLLLSFSLDSNKGPEGKILDYEFQHRGAQVRDHTSLSMVGRPAED